MRTHKRFPCLCALPVGGDLSLYGGRVEVRPGVRLEAWVRCFAHPSVVLRAGVHAQCIAFAPNTEGFLALFFPHVFTGHGLWVTSLVLLAVHRQNIDLHKSKVRPAGQSETKLLFRLHNGIPYCFIQSKPILFGPLRAIFSQINIIYFQDF